MGLKVYEMVLVDIGLFTDLVGAISASTGGPTSAKVGGAKIFVG